MHRYVFSSGGNLRPSHPTKRRFLSLALTKRLPFPPLLHAISGPLRAFSILLSLVISILVQHAEDRLDSCLCLVCTQPPPSVGSVPTPTPLSYHHQELVYVPHTNDANRLDSTLVESAPDASATHTSKTTPSIDRALHCHPRWTTRRDPTSCGEFTLRPESDVQLSGIQ